MQKFHNALYLNCNGPATTKTVVELGLINHWEPTQPTGTQKMHDLVPIESYAENKSFLDYKRRLLNSF